MELVATLVPTLIGLIGLGFTLGLNPALYGATADMLARNVKALPRLIYMVGGLYVGATILFLVLQHFNPTSFVHALRGRVSHFALNREVDLVAGLAFLAFAAGIALWALRVKELPKKPPKKPKENANLFSYALIGLSCAIVGFTTLPIMYLTGRMVAGVSHHIELRVVAYLVFLAALGAPFFALAWVWRRFPLVTARVTAFYTSALNRDYRWIGAIASAIIGVVFLVMAGIPRS